MPGDCNVPLTFKGIILEAYIVQVTPEILATRTLKVMHEVSSKEDPTGNRLGKRKRDRKRTVDQLYYTLTYFVPAS